MSIQSGDRVSFVLSGLSREQQNARRRAGNGDDIDVRSVAAAVGACSSDHEALYEDSHSREPPPRIRGRRTCCTTIVVIWTLCATATLAFQLASSSRFFEPSSDASFERRVSRDESIHDQIRFGVWDSHRAVTKLQLQVSVSVALGVRAADGDVVVDAEDNFFFRIVVDHATIEELEYIASTAFFDRLNIQLNYYDGFGVLSKPPLFFKNSSSVR